MLVSRRAFLGRATMGLGSVALSALVAGVPFEKPASHRSSFRGSLIGPQEVAVPGPAAKPAKRVIWLYMAGGMSHLEGWDHKPILREMDGKTVPPSMIVGQQVAQLQGAREMNCMAPQFPFQRWGQSGLEFSTCWPCIGSQIADEICLIRSMYTDAINHDPAHALMNTGSMLPGRPSIGSWLHYGLGAERDDLPGFVVMVSTGSFGQAQPISSRLWHSGFLPGRYQGVEFRSKGDPVMYIQPPDGVSSGQQRDVVDAIQELSRLSTDSLDDSEIDNRVAQYETAFHMQTSVPELTDFSNEPQHVLDRYGAAAADGSFAANCLMARRLAERGTRFIQLYHRDWDHHGGVKSNFAGTAAEVDRGIAALVVDLKERGMLEDTLVVLGTEFGRTPMAQSSDGRDHHLAGFSMWMAGGGIKRGMTYGATDDLGYYAVEDRTHINDIHATVLHRLGLDHRRLTYRYQGRDFRLTDVGGSVIEKILA